MLANMIFTRRVRLGATVAATALLMAGCTSSGHSGGQPGSTSTRSTPNSSAGATTPATSAAQYYVSIGDSYAAGYQPTRHGAGATTRNGFAYQVVTGAKAKGYHFDLVNFACAGAVTASVLHSPGCPKAALGPGAAGYAPKTQGAAAVAFLRAHAGHIGLVTVSIGGNDVGGCGAAANPTACVGGALNVIKANLATLLTEIRGAAGAGTPIVGITYPDVLLAGAVSGDAAKKNLAQLSVFAFSSLINPTLKTLYTAAGAKFVDVTAATGAYGPMTATTSLAPYGTIPIPVAKICQLTYMCQYQDIHPRTNGYALIANLIVATLPTH